MHKNTVDIKLESKIKFC